MKSFKIFTTICMMLLSIMGIAQNVGINNTNPQASLDVQGDLRLRSAVLNLPVGLNGDVDLITTKSSVYMFGGAALGVGGCQITGFTGGIDGRMITIFNNSVNGAMQLYDASNGISIANSAAANRIITGTGNSAIIYGNGSVTLRYDGAKASWIVTGSNYVDGLSTTTTTQWNVAGNNISNNNTGNVGIGNALPLMKLDVKTNDSAALLLNNSTTIGANLKTSLYFKTGNIYSGGIGTIGSSATHRMGFFTYGGSSPSDLRERMSIADGGNVGIGITNPMQAKLVVNGDFGKLTNAVFGGDGSGISFQKNWPTIGYNSYRDDANTQRYMATGYAYVTSVDQVNGTYFWNKLGYGATDNSVAANEQTVMALTQDGKLGIGTTAPSATLSVLRGTAFDGTAAFGGTTHTSNFNYGASEDTYIRGGKDNAKVYLADNLGGAVGIGTLFTAGYKLAVNGNIRTKEVVVESGWADYVFAKDYKLPSLTEVEKYIKANNHLPEIPSAQEIQENGLKVGELQTKMMQKIEELTLYIIELNKEIELLKVKK